MLLVGICLGSRPPTYVLPAFCQAGLMLFYNRLGGQNQLTVQAVDGLAGCQLVKSVHKGGNAPLILHCLRLTQISPPPVFGWEF